jgi:hypothetical protein
MHQNLSIWARKPLALELGQRNPPNFLVPVVAACALVLTDVHEYHRSPLGSPMIAEMPEQVRRLARLAETVLRSR